MAATKTPYSVHPGLKMVEKWVATLRGKTGRSLEEWMALLKKSGPKTEKERREWLKDVHGMGTNSAWWIAERAEGKPSHDESPEAYLAAAEKWVESMFSGKKQALRPIYDKLLKLGLATGKEAKACPCQTIVPLYRNHVFAQIKPTTNARIDVGFALGSRQTTGRLVDTGGYAKKDRITHRIPITSPAEIDDEVKTWLRVAYDADEVSLRVLQLGPFSAKINNRA
jgi:hypothetical protein